MFTLDLDYYKSAMPSMSVAILAIGALHSIISIFISLGTHVPDFILPTIIILTLLTLSSAPTTSATPSIPGYMATPIVIGYPRAPFDRIVETVKVVAAYTVGFHYLLQWHPIITPHITSSNAVSLIWYYLVLPILHAIATVFSTIGGPTIAHQVSAANQSIWTAAFTSQEWFGASQTPSSSSETLAMYGTFVMRLPSIMNVTLVIFMIYMSKTNWPFPPLTTLFSFTQGTKAITSTMDTIRSYLLAKALRLYLHFYPSRVKGSGAYGLDIIKPSPAVREAYQLHYPTPAPTPDFTHLIIDRRVGFGLDATPQESGAVRRKSVKTLDWKACGLSQPVERVRKAVPRKNQVAPVNVPSKKQLKQTSSMKITPPYLFGRVPISKSTPSPPRHSYRPESKRSLLVNPVINESIQSESVSEPKVIVPSNSASVASPSEVTNTVPEISIPIAADDLASLASLATTHAGTSADAKVVQIPLENVSALAALVTPPISKPIAPRTPTQSTEPRKTWRPSSTGFSFAAPPMSAKLAQTTLTFASETKTESFVFGGKTSETRTTAIPTSQSFVFGGKPQSTESAILDEAQTPTLPCSQVEIKHEEAVPAPERQKPDFSVAPSLSLDPPPAYRDLRTELEVRRAQELASISARQASLEAHFVEPPPYQYAVDDCDLSDYVARLSIDDPMECECEAPSKPKRKSLIRAWAIHKPRGSDHATRNSGTRFAPRHSAVKDVFSLRTSQELHLDAKLQHNRRSMQDMRLVAAGTGTKPKVSTWVERTWWHLTNPRAKRSALVNALPPGHRSTTTRGATAPRFQPVPEIVITPALDKVVSAAPAKLVETAPPAPKAVSAPVFSFSAALPSLPQAPKFTLKQETVIERLETDIDELYVEEAMEFGIAEAEKRRLVRIEQASVKVKSRVELKAARERRANLRQRC